MSQTEPPIHVRLPFVSRPDGQAWEVIQDGHILVAQPSDPQLRGARQPARWSLLGEMDRATGLRLVRLDSNTKAPFHQEVLAVVEAALSLHPTQSSLHLHAPGLDQAALLDSGVLLTDGLERRVCRDLFWQQARMWMLQSGTPFPLQYTVSQGRRHPRRPPKTTGKLYERFIPWLDKTFSFRTLDIEQDIERFHRWMNDSAVAQFWNEEGPLDKQRRYLQAITDDPHMRSLIACLDGVPFGYFEVYWAKENRIAPFYDVDDYDRGWHVLVGEPAFRGKRFATAWLTSISHYLFLDDPRTQRVVGEPRADHAQQIRNLDRSGFAKVKEFDFPHKRALLISMQRERYFGERLWLPRDEPATLPLHATLEPA